MPGSAWVGGHPLHACSIQACDTEDPALPIWGVGPSVAAGRPARGMVRAHILGGGVGGQTSLLEWEQWVQGQGCL